MRFRQRYLVGNSRSSYEAGAFLQGKFDLALVCPSWDHRCNLLTQGEELWFEDAIVLRFETKDTQGYQTRHEEEILGFLSTHARKVHLIDGDSVKVDIIWEQLWRRVREISLAGQRPLRAFVDLSTCPRYYGLGLVAGLFDCGFAAEVCVFYAEGEYSLEESPLPLLDYPFSIGQWNTVPIPFLRGTVNPAKRKAFIVSVGFEGVKTARVLSKEDPDRVSMLYPIPGVRLGYDNLTLECNAAVVNDFSVRADSILMAQAGDAIGVWKALSMKVLDCAEEETYYLCCGTKPHALGMALRALCLKFPTVLYNIPEKHTFVEVKSNGVFWRFDLRDVSAMPRYSKGAL